jgi:hypothetical protein
MLGFVAGCAYIVGSRDTISSGFDKEQKRTGSFVFGYIDMKEADPDLDWALLYHFAQGEQTKSIPMRTSEGAYYLENVPPGSYSIGEFGGRATNFFSAGALIAFRPYFYTIGTEPAFRVKIEKPGIYFVGAHKFQPHKSDKSGSDKFELNPLDSPTQKEILAKIVERAKGSPWEPALRSYLAKLK